MITVDQLDKNLNDMLAGWFTNFEPLYIAVFNLKTNVMQERIFGKGTSGGSNTDGTKLPTEPYSTKPIYVSPTSLRNAPSQFKKGKRGTAIKSLYFPFGYAQIKTQTSAVLPLQLTGALNRSWISTPVSEDGLTATIEIGTEQIGKVDGLESKYGIIFQPSDEEQQDMLILHTELIIEQINKQFNG
jgi:hypothetical protein